jgi:hypothetical protein
MTDFGGQRSGDWTCSCGRVYRVRAVDGEVQMWPEPIGELCACGAPIGRGTVLSALYGAVVAFGSEGFEPLHGSGALAGGRVVVAEETQIER